MRPSGLSHLLIIVLSVAFQQLLQNGDYMRTEVGLAGQRVDYARNVDLPGGEQGRELVVGDVGLQGGHQEIDVGGIDELGDDLHLLVALLDCLVDVDGLRVQHLIVKLLLDRRVHAQDHHFVRVVDVRTQERLLVKGRSNHSIHVFVLSNLIKHKLLLVSLGICSII